MGLIFSFSSDNAESSTKKSDGFIIKTVQVVLGRELSQSEKDKWLKLLVVPVRKLAHFTLYFILGLLVFNFIFEFSFARWWGVYLSIGISFLYACSDEVHQLFVPGRSGQVSDVLLDTFGSCVGIFLYFLVVRWCSGREQKEGAN